MAAVHDYEGNELQPGERALCAGTFIDSRDGETALFRPVGCVEPSWFVCVPVKSLKRVDTPPPPPVNEGSTM